MRNKIAILTALILLLSAPLFAAAPRVLVYQKNGKGFVHDNLAASATAIPYHENECDES